MKTKTDYDLIRREHPLPPIVEASGVRLEKNGREYKACCPFHAEKSASFTLFTGKTGYWKFHCYGCGATGDVIDYVKERYGCDNAEAIRIVTGEDTQRQPLATQAYVEAADPYEGYDIGRPPQGTPPIVAGEKTPAILNPKRIDAKTGRPKVVTYKPTMVFPYRSRNGDLIGYVLRVEIDGKKLTPQVWWTKNGNAGFEGWSHGSFPSPRPMYGLEDFEANPDYQVLLVEGEKCRDAAKRLMAGKRVVAASWMGGGKAISRTHWRSLQGRSVVIWPDNDEEGWRTTLGYVDKQGRWTKGLVEYCYEAGAKAVKVIHITRDSRREGWDIADAEAEGLEQRGVELIMRDRIKAWSREDIAAHQKKEIENDRVHRSGAIAGGNGNSGLEDINTQGDDRATGSTHRASGEAPSDGVQSERLPARPRGRGYDISEEDWRSHLIMKADGEGLKANSLQNCALLLQFDRRFAGIFAWNTFAKEVYLQRRPPWDISGQMGHWTKRKVTEPDVTSAACWLEYCGMSPKRNDVGSVIARVAQHNAYNPVVERLDELVWDGVPRLSGNESADPDEYTAPWMSAYLGANDTFENRAFGRRWMIGAIARAFQPGCKMDTMLILEGQQGLKKSTALRILSDAVVPGVFTDEISDPNSKDAGMQMQGAFIIEIAELDSFRRADISQIKAWLSRQTDRFRRPYGKIVEEFPRSCVFAGTVNPTGGGYLKDASGARRMWPVACHEIDLEGLRAIAPQLWAEAVAAYRDGERWWLDEEEQRHARFAQENRYEEDPYNDMIDAYLTERSKVTVMAILKDALEIPPERRNSLAHKRVTTHLYRRKWRKTVEGEQTYYTRPDALAV